MKKLLVAASVVCFCVVAAVGQNSNSSTVDPSMAPPTRTRTTAPPKPSPTPRTVTKSATPQATPSSTPSRNETSGGPTSPSGAVVAAFNALLEGIRNADVKVVTNAYQNTPRLLLFNYNGTVTKGWDQLKANREASYPNMKDVKLDVRDLRVTMLGTTAALITCQWTQSMTFNGTPETDTGRMTIVFRKVGKDWKAVHLHTSPDNPDPSRVPPSEQATPRPDQNWQIERRQVPEP
jgi:ketosteroid isomerase-like protein